MGQLDLADGTADAAISRMGLLLFGDPPAAATELARVLKPGGHFSIKGAGLVTGTDR